MEPIIKVEHLSKEFGQKGSGVHALNDVSISIEKGIFTGSLVCLEQERVRLCAA